MSNENKTSGPAFPVLIVDRPKELAHFNGMTLRQYASIKAAKMAADAIRESTPPAAPSLSNEEVMALILENQNLRAEIKFGIAPVQPVVLPLRETEAMHDAVMSVIYQGVSRTNTDALWQAYRKVLITTPPTAAQQEVTVPDDMSHAGQIKIAPDGDLHIIATGKDSWTGKDCTVAIELTASGGREGAKWYKIFRDVMLATANQPAAAQPAQPAVPEGWKLVPIQPTDEMIDGGLSKVDDLPDFYRVDAVAVYQAMLTAAPEKGQP
jgi:hypothetical protein